MKNLDQNQHILWLFCLCGGIAIVCGGLFAAFSATAPSQTALWLSAYLVLVVGVVQIGMGVGLARLVVKPLSPLAYRLPFLLYNIGNSGVVAGTLHHAFLIVVLGAVLLSASLLSCLFLIRRSQQSWWKVGYCALLIATFISSVVGVAIAR